MCLRGLRVQPQRLLRVSLRLLQSLFLLNADVRILEVHVAKARIDKRVIPGELQAVLQELQCLIEFLSSVNRMIALRARR